MPEVIVGQVDDPPSWTAAVQAFGEWNPGYTLGQGAVGSALTRSRLTATPGRSAVLLALRRPRRGLAPGRLSDPRRRRGTAAVQPILPIR